MYSLSGRADSDIDHYLVVAKVRERPAVSKNAAQKFDVERLNLKLGNKSDTWSQWKAVQLPCKFDLVFSR